jgi:hypothetical protein
MDTYMELLTDLAMTNGSVHDGKLHLGKILVVVGG